MKILCICNYGLVRSRTMANRLKQLKIDAFALGICNTYPNQMHQYMNIADKVIICNKINIDEKLCKDIANTKMAADMLHNLETYKDKIITCDTIGRDCWGQENHPDLIKICDQWIGSHLNDFNNGGSQDGETKES